MRVRDFADGDEATFRRLNEEWITRYFSLEEKDRRLFDDPKGQILAAGGTILILEHDGEPVGCCALVNKDDDTFELAKMAVSPAHQGRGLGKVLLDSCVQRGKLAGKKRLTLETNSGLHAALALYRKFGFVEIPRAAWPPMEFTRVDVLMELWL